MESRKMRTREYLLLCRSRYPDVSWISDVWYIIYIQFFSCQR